MKYVSEKYEQQLSDLAEHLMRPIGDAALQDTIEFEPVRLPEIARIYEFPTAPRPPEAA